MFECTELCVEVWLGFRSVLQCVAVCYFMCRDSLVCVAVCEVY